MASKRRKSLAELIDRQNMIRLVAKRLSKAADDGCAEFRNIQSAVPGGCTFDEIEDAIDGTDDFVMNVGLRVGSKVYDLDKPSWSAEWIGDE